MNKKTINTILIAIFLILLVFSGFIVFKNNKVGYENFHTLQNIKNKTVIENKPIKITIWWDVMLSRVVGYFNKKEWYDRITKKYNPITQTWGIIFLNLESPFSKKDKDWFHSSYLFWANVKNIQTLKDLKWSNEMIVSLANNHIKNSGLEWIDTSMKVLNKSKIYYSWIWYKKEKDVEFTKIIKWQNKICFQAFSYDWWNYWKYKIYKVEKKEIKKFLDEMKKERCDLSIISLHWWREYKFEPNKEQVKLAHYIIDNWADMIIWHHSHIFWKTETYKDKPIFYSLWNYIFDQDDLVNNCNKYISCIYDKKLKKKIRPVNIGVSYELIFDKYLDVPWGYKLTSKIQKKHRIEHYWELLKY